MVLYYNYISKIKPISIKNIVTINMVNHQFTKIAVGKNGS